MTTRRHFLKTSSALGLVTVAPSVARLAGLHNSNGLVSSAQAAQLETADFQLPAMLPQIINIFLYGGASELAGNLTNIEHIAAVSQNPYPQDLLQTSDSDSGEITRNRFWKSAGGGAMEAMLADGDLSVYRTINRRKNNTRAHRPSIFSSQKGSLNIDAAGGMGSTIAAVFNANRHLLDGSTQLRGKTVDELVLPFVSFEGTSIAFAQNPNKPLPLRMRGLSLDEQFDNPYSRAGARNDSELNALLRQMEQSLTNNRFQRIRDAFAWREGMEAVIGELQAAIDNPLPVVPAEEVGLAGDSLDMDIETNRLQYPADNQFSARIRAAVTLAISNPDTQFISLGGGLSGWDDHDGALDSYVPRMNQLMQALRVAMKHIRYSGVENGGIRDTSNIIINVHGDFGRNANLNNSSGWDHGNNQTFFTMGGNSIRPAGALGKIVGTTEVFGSAEQNRLFTRPAGDSYEAEPMAIAASTYRYYGVNNPRALTHDGLYNPDGDDAIDETVAGVMPG